MLNENKSSAFKNIGVPLTEIMMVLLVSTWNELIPSVGGFLGLFFCLSTGFSEAFFRW